MLSNYSRKCILLTMLLISLTISGCWDRKEIENRGYVLGVAIDYAMPNQSKKDDLKYAPQSVGERKYRLTYELPKFRKQEASGEVSKAASHLIFAAEGESMFAATRAINTKTYFGMFFEDIQSIVFSEEVARGGIMEVLDFFQRDAEMRRRVKLFVTPNRAEDILKAKLQVEEVNGVFIAKTMANVGKSPYFASKTELGQISKSLRNNRPFAMPIVVNEDKEIQLKKAAIFNREAKMIGELNQLELIGAKILRNNLKQGVIVAPNPANPMRLITFEIYEAKINLVPVLENNQLRFSLSSKFIGTLGENMEPRQDAFDPSFTTAVEYAIANEVKQLIYAGYVKQQYLKAEVSDLARLVHIRYPHYWKEIKDRWDTDVFPTVPLEVEVEILIRRPVIKK